MLAKSSKILIFPRENQYFQEIEVQKKEKNRTKTDEKLHVFSDIDFEGVLERVRGGFWEAKTIDFRTFVDVFSTYILNSFSKSQKNVFFQFLCKNDLPKPSQDGPFKKGFCYVFPCFFGHRF